ncbi:MAG: hypothetical protein QJR12_16845 [Mycobacterium sp.]|uniref:hypothetical protein n=1 Tax=Mycobacterium sp. TaxID=1785 RepID=UPI002627BC6D|nr:hypothetical protein [Mycobacterium sp.]MDI3315875.1 hypothetical protein [Mycobacterium sp.]
MPSRLLLPDDAVREVDIRTPYGTRRYRPGRDGTVTPASAHDERALREMGATLASAGGGLGGRGKRCTSCGFLGYFVRCGRCGGHCEPEQA